jgi:hypothetical protein
VKISVADPDPGSDAFLTLYPGYGMGKKAGSGSGMNNPDHISESLETIFWVKMLKFFDADPGWKKFGFGTNIQDLQHRRKCLKPSSTLRLLWSKGVPLDASW